VEGNSHDHLLAAQKRVADELARAESNFGHVCNYFFLTMSWEEDASNETKVSALVVVWMLLLRQALEVQN